MCRNPPPWVAVMHKAATVGRGLHKSALLAVDRIQPQPLVAVCTNPHRWLPSRINPRLLAVVSHKAATVGRGLLRCQRAQHGVGRLAVDRVVLLKMPDGGAFDRSVVTKRPTKNVVEKVALELGFVKLPEAAAGFLIGPADQNFVSFFDGPRIEQPAFAGL